MHQEPVAQVVPATATGVRSGAGLSPVAIGRPAGDGDGPGSTRLPSPSPAGRASGSARGSSQPSLRVPEPGKAKREDHCCASSGSVTASAPPHHATPRHALQSRRHTAAPGPSPVEVLKGVGELQAAEDDEGLQDPLQPPQRPRAARSPVELLDLHVKVAGELLAHLRKARGWLRRGLAGWPQGQAGGTAPRGASGKPWGSQAGAEGAQASGPGRSVPAPAPRSLDSRAGW